MDRVGGDGNGATMLCMHSYCPPTIVCRFGVKILTSAFFIVLI